MRAISNATYVTTDDGSYGRHGFVTDQLKDILDSGNSVGAVFAIGPLPMMKAVADLTRSVRRAHPRHRSTPSWWMAPGCAADAVSSVGGEMKFACVDGPEFDGHKVDFDELMMRNRTYVELERISDERHHCRLAGLTQENVQ